MEFIIPLSEGSPPQVRGKLFNLLSIIRKNRITPAGAGKTVDTEQALVVGQDHPRRCGENVAAKIKEHKLTGITPAGAGKTRWNSSKMLIREDHPRRCGENSSPRSKRLQASGSPPQVRGKPGLPNTLNSLPRITPAGAGKTFGLGLLWIASGDHPRRCGEN